MLPRRMLSCLRRIEPQTGNICQETWYLVTIRTDGWVHGSFFNAFGGDHPTNCRKVFLFFKNSYYFFYKICPDVFWGKYCPSTSKFFFFEDDGKCERMSFAAGFHLHAHIQQQGGNFLAPRHQFNFRRITKLTKWWKKSWRIYPKEVYLFEIEVYKNREKLIEGYNSKLIFQFSPFFMLGSLVGRHGEYPESCARASNFLRPAPSPVTAAVAIAFTQECVQKLPLSF